MFIKFHNNFINKKLLFLLITVNTKIILSWDLISLGIQQDNYRLEHVSLYFLRAFICVSYTPPSLTPSSTTVSSLSSLSSSSLALHSHNNNNNNNSNINNQSYSIKSLPTLIETTWPENLLILKPKFFPNLNAHALNDDRMDCKKLHQIKWTDIDDYGRLWIFDAGNNFNCNPKIVIYDLLRKNKEIFRTDCLGFNGNEVTMMKIDPDSSTFGYYAAYFTLSHGRYLSVFNLQDNKWYKIKISIGNEWDKKPIDVHEIAFTLDYRIYLADKIGNLYIANLDNKMRNSTELIAKPLGSLLGRPKGLITDPLGVLYYILPQHGAIVRWEPSRTLNAEGHDILHFQSIPIVQIIFGVQGSVWIASERFYAAHDHCYRILYHFSVSASEQ